MIPELPTYLFDYSWAGVLSLVLTVILPLVAAVIMKATWASWIKGVTLLFVAAVKAFVEALVLAGSDFNVNATLYAVLINYGIAVVVYFGLLRGTQIQAAALNSGNK